MFGSPKGRTELKIGGSGAENCAEHHGNTRFCIAPQKPVKNCEKQLAPTKSYQKRFFLPKRLWVQAHKRCNRYPGAGELYIGTLQKKNFFGLRKIFEAVDLGKID